MSVSSVWPNPATEELHNAASRGDLPKVKECLSDLQRNGIGIPMHWNSNPLRAVLGGNGSIEIMRTLIGFQADLIDAKSPHGETLLHLAAQKSKEELAIYLMKKKPVLAEEVNSRGETVLHIAASNLLEELVAEILAVDYFKLNAKNSSELTALDMINQKLTSLNYRQHGWCKIWKAQRIRLKLQYAGGKHGEEGDVEEARSAMVERVEEEKVAYKEMKDKVFVKSTIVLTLTFATVFQIPGGVDASGTGRAVLAHRPAFRAYLLAVALTVTMCTLVEILLVVANPRSSAGRSLVLYVALSGFKVSVLLAGVAFDALLYLYVGLRFTIVIDAAVMGLGIVFMLITWCVYTSCLSTHQSYTLSSQVNVVFGFWNGLDRP